MLVIIFYWLQKGLNIIYYFGVSWKRGTSLDSWPMGLLLWKSVFLRQFLISVYIVYPQLHDSPRSCFTTINNLWASSHLGKFISVPFLFCVFLSQNIFTLILGWCLLGLHSLFGVCWQYSMDDWPKRSYHL